MGILDITLLRNKHFLALVGNGIISVFSVVMMSLIYRALDKVQVGSWFFFLTVYGLADAIRNGFLSTATVKFYSGTGQERAREVLGSIWFLAIAVTALLTLIDLCFLPFVGYFANPSTIATIHWFAPTLFSALPYTIAYWILVADERYIPILWLRLINSGSMILIVLVLMYLNKMSLHTLLLFNFFTNCLTSIAAYSARLTKNKTFFHRSWKSIIEIANFGKYSLATNLSSNLLSSTNTFILNFFLGPAAVAVYTLPTRLMEIIEIPLRSFVGTGMSGMAAAFNNNDMGKVAAIFKKYSGMLTWVFVPIAILAFIFADLAIGLLGGGKYIHTEAPNVYRLFMLMAIFYPIDRFNGVTLDIIHMPKMNFYKVLIMLFACVVSDLVGISISKSIYGIAFASPITLLTGILVGYVALKKHIDYSFRDVFTIGFKECMDLIIQKILTPFFGYKA